VPDVSSAPGGPDQMTRITESSLKVPSRTWPSPLHQFVWLLGDLSHHGGIPGPHVSVFQTLNQLVVSNSSRLQCPRGVKSLGGTKCT
jgi:hypothetical protein